MFFAHWNDIFYQGHTMSMKMLQARIRGLGSTIETEWFELGPRLNLFNFSNRDTGTRFINGLQTINPPYWCHGVRPFRDFPNISRHRGHLRRISPKKRTIAMAVFAAPPELVGELAQHSDLLYETDRIEVGRRLDYSRWMNFVELASSTRWSEIAADIDHLLLQATQVAPHLAEELHTIIAPILPSDRVKRELKNSLLNWLQNARQELGPEFVQMIDATRDAVMRADFFQAARETVYKRLPLFIALGSSHLCQSSDQLLQWMNGQHLQEISKPHPEPSILEGLNHQLALLDICESPIRVDCIDTNFLIRDYDARGGKNDSSPDNIMKSLQTTVCLAIALCRTLCRTEPILLFDSPETLIPTSSHQAMVQFIGKISEICQCLYVSPQIDIFPADRRGKVFSEPMLARKGQVSPLKR